jgi:RNA polymerase sigma-70 factor (ECF subfamily)
MQKHSMSAQDQEATFRRWLDEHIGLILKVVRGCASSPQDQDDLFQDVLLQIWSSIPAFRGEAKETTWIYRVAFNTALAWRRGERRRREGHERFIKLVERTEAQPGHVDESPEQEIVERLYAAIRQLTKIDAALALMHLDGLSYQEMAAVIGISENYIGVKLNRIRRQLAQQLKGPDNELG